MENKDEANELLESYVTPAGMAAAHAALIARYAWYLHVSDAEHFESIQKGGLKPNNPGCAPHGLVTKYLGTKAHAILCLRPLATLDTTPGRSTSRFALAVDSAALPRLIGLDWSFGGVWALAKIIKNDAPQMSAEDVFCEVIRRRGSVVCYDGIAPSSLRVRCNGHSPEDPAQWNELMSVERKDIAIF